MSTLKQTIGIALILIFVLLLRSCVDAVHAQQEELHFNVSLSQWPSLIKLPGTDYWRIVGGSEHQNAVIHRCQELLIEKGVNDLTARKFGCAIYLAENEPMDPLRLGDRGHAFGICQRNLGRVSAKAWLDKNPEWKTAERQLQYCTDRFAASWKTYGNVFQATVQHNSPAAAARNRDACHISPCYFQRVSAKASLLSL